MSPISASNRFENAIATHNSSHPSGLSTWVCRRGKECAYKRWRRVSVSELAISRSQSVYAAVDPCHCDATAPSRFATMSGQDPGNKFGIGDVASHFSRSLAVASAVTIHNSRHCAALPCRVLSGTGGPQCRMSFLTECAGNVNISVSQSQYEMPLGNHRSNSLCVRQSNSAGGGSHVVLRKSSGAAPGAGSIRTPALAGGTDALWGAIPPDKPVQSRHDPVAATRPAG